MGTANPGRARRWRLLAPASLGIVLFSAFAALGTWQVQRHFWKRELIARVEARVHAAPVPLPSADAWPQVQATRHEYLAVAVEGRWMPAHTVLVQAVTAQGGGYWVMTPLQLADGAQVLVNRGFIPQALGARWHGEDPVRGDEPVLVRGLLRMSEPGGGFLRRNDAGSQRWYSRDVVAIAHGQGLARAAPFFVDAGLPGDPPLADGTWPRPGMTAVRFFNGHLAYVFTWYTLAFMVAAAAWVVARYERGQHREPRSDQPHERHHP
jgi:surfeit locus 1 family protein